VLWLLERAVASGDRAGSSWHQRRFDKGVVVGNAEAEVVRVPAPRRAWRRA